MLPRTHSKAYLESLLHPPTQASGAIGSRPITLHRTSSFKSNAGGTTASSDHYKPAKSSTLAVKDPVSVKQTTAEEGDTEGDLERRGSDEEELKTGDLDDSERENGSSSETSQAFSRAVSVASTDDDGDEPSRHLRISTLQNAARRSSVDNGVTGQYVAQNVQAILAILDDERVDDEDRVEQVRNALAIKMKEVEGSEVPAARLDNIVLALLHRHREDLKPTGITFPTATSPSPSPFPASPRSRPRPANLRAGSGTTLVRPWTPTRPTTPTNHTSNDGAFSPATSPMPSALGGGSLGMTSTTGSPRASPSIWHRTLTQANFTTPTALSAGTSRSNAATSTAGSRPISPIPGATGSPSLSVTAVEFKPRTGGVNGGASSMMGGAAASNRTTRSQTPTEPWHTSNDVSRDLFRRAPSASHAAEDSDEDEFSPFAVPIGQGVPVPSSSSSSTSSARLAAHRSRPISGNSGNSSLISMTTADSVSGSYHGSTTSASLESSDDPRSLRFTGLEDDMDNLLMTPFDVLTSVLNGMGAGEEGANQWTPEQIDEALERHGWDVDATITAIMDGTVLSSNHDSISRATRSPSSNSRAIPTGPASSRSGVSVVSQEIFANQRAGLLGSSGPGELGLTTGAYARGQPANASPSPSLNAPPMGAVSQQQQQQFQQMGRPGPGRVCRFFLSGECRRADCRFSHDLNRALCRFWLKGQCLNGEDCSFLHDMSMIDSAGAAVSTRMTNSQSPLLAPADAETPPAEDFPELNLAPPTGPKAQQRHRAGQPVAADPSRVRWSQAVQRKWNTPMAQVQHGEAHISLQGVPTGPKASVQAKATSAASARTASARIPLRAPLLLPTLPTGRAATQAYASHREACIALSEKRNKCLARAAEAWKAGNGAEARRWSQEGQSLNRLLQDESRSVARSVVRGRHEEIRTRIVGDHGQTGLVNASTDERGARGMRGRLMGAELGICLGIVPASAPTVPSHLATLSTDERAEVLFDCHLLHANEAVELIEEFLLALEREQFRGLAILAVGLGKHTSAETDRRRVSIAPAVRAFLTSWSYPFAEHDGVLVVDPLSHS